MRTAFGGWDRQERITSSHLSAKPTTPFFFFSSLQCDKQRKATLRFVLRTYPSRDVGATMSEMNRAMTRLVTLLLCGAFCVLFSHLAWGTEISIPVLEARAGESVDVPIMIDQVDNLAGVKLILEYDAKLLTFNKGTKTKNTNSLMHIINDKKPGRLIIVMAGARGIKGKGFAILILQFAIDKALTEKKTTEFKINGVELMSDKLKEIKAEIKVNPLTILPQQAPTQKNPPKNALPGNKTTKVTEPE